jgi:hypothetical protein
VDTAKEHVVGTGYERISPDVEAPAAEHCQVRSLIFLPDPAQNDDIPVDLTSVDRILLMYFPTEHRVRGVPARP